MARSGDNARQLLVEQAERLFAERGIEAVSLRDVSAAAKQRNHSAAQYHFGDRQGLIAAVYHARMGEVDRRRQRRLGQLNEAGMGNDLRSLVEAAVAPLIEVVAETDGWYARFLARTRWDTMAWTVLADVPELNSYRAVVRRIVLQLDDMPAEIRRSRADQLLTLVVGTVAGWEWARHRGDPRLSQAALTTDLVTTAVALMCAPFDSTPHSTELTGATS